MRLLSTKIPDLLLIEPKVSGDERGFFFESFNKREFSQKTGLLFSFVQDNHSRSSQGVLRGLHYQVKQPQGKLVRVVRGVIFDVVVDLRPDSPTFKHWDGLELSEENHYQLWVPPGFAHGFMVLSESAEVLYKTTDYYAPEHERTILWSDPTLGIQWPQEYEIQLSEKDKKGMSFSEAMKEIIT